MLALARRPSPPQPRPTDLFQSIYELPGGELDDWGYKLADDGHGHQQAFPLLGPDNRLAHQLFFDFLCTTYTGSFETNILQKT